MSLPADTKMITLPNGLRIVVNQRPGLGFVHTNILVRCGSLDDPEGLEGLSCVLGDVAMRGSKKYSRDDIRAIEDRGGNTHAFTTRESTTFYALAFPEDFAATFDILSDVVLAPALAAEDLEYEQSLTISGIQRSQDNPKSIARDLLMETAFPGQPAGKPVNGTEASISRLTRDDLVAQHAAFYNPSDMVIAVAGDITAEEVEALAAAKFSGVSPNPRKARKAPAYMGGDARLAQQDRSQLNISLAFPGIAQNDPDRYAATVLADILGGGMTSRLFMEVREKHGLVYGISARNAHMENGGLFTISAGTGDDKGEEGETPKPRNIETMLPIICRELRKTMDGISEEEVQGTVNGIRMSFAMQNISSGSVCSSLGQTTLSSGNPVSTEDSLAAYRKVTVEDVKRVARKIFSGQPAFVAVGPLEGLPSYEDICRMMKGDPAKPRIAPAPAPHP